MAGGWCASLSARGVSRGGRAWGAGVRIGSGASPSVAERSLAAARRAGEASLTKLATGKRINRAADDPAGLIAATKLSSDLVVNEKRAQRYEFELRSLGAQDGVLSVVGDLLVELEGVVVTAANAGALSARERSALQDEADSIIEAIDRLSATSRFNGQRTAIGLDSRSLGVISGRTREDGGGAGETLRLADLRGGGKLKLTGERLEEAQEVVRAAVSDAATRRAAVGARTQSVESELRVLADEFVNLSDARSRIEDTDFAAETSRLVRAQILEEASIRAILVEREQREGVLRLLESATAGVR